MVAVVARALARRDRRDGAPRQHRHRARARTTTPRARRPARARARVRPARGARAGQAAHGRPDAHDRLRLHRRRRVRRPRRAALREPRRYRRRIVAAVVNLDAIGGDGPRRAHRVRRRSAALVPPAPRSSRPRPRACSSRPAPPARPGALAQLIDLGFPFSFYEQAPLIGAAIPALSLTTAGPRPPAPETDTIDALNDRRIGQIGRAAEALLGSLDEGVALARDTSTYLYIGGRTVQGWAVQLVLITALLPFLLAAVDLFARCRRRRIPLAPALRSYRGGSASGSGRRWCSSSSRCRRLAAAGASPRRPAHTPAGDWPAVTLTIFAVFVFASWLVGRERLLPRRPASPEEELAGQTRRAARARRRGAARRRDEPVRAHLPAAVAPRLALASAGARPGAALGARRPARRLRSGRCCCWARSPGASTSASTRRGTSLELAAIGYVPLPRSLIAVGWLAAAGQLAARSAHRPLRAVPDRSRAAPRPGPIRAVRRSCANAPRPGARLPCGTAKAREELSATLERVRRRTERDRIAAPRAALVLARRGRARAASAAAARAIMCDSWPVTARARQRRRPTRSRAREQLVARGFARHRAPRASPARTGAAGRRRPGGRARRPHEELEADERRDRVPGQPEDERPVRHAERDRLRPASRPRPRSTSSTPSSASIAGRDRAGPTETPPEVTSTSSSSPRASLAMRGLVVGDRVEALDLQRRPSAAALARISTVRLVDLPGLERLARPAKLGSRREDGGPRAPASTTTSATPAAASAPSCAGRRRVPASTTTSPRRTSPPEGRMLAPTATGSDSSIVLSFSTTYSKGMTASAPAGTTPPVAIPIASPSSSDLPAGLPAGMRSRTGSRPGVSLDRRAKPSIAELSNGGSSTRDLAGSARTRPAPESSTTGSASSGRTRSRISRCASSMDKSAPTSRIGSAAVISVVVPVHDEERTVALLYDELAVRLQPLGSRGRPSSSTTARPTARSPR